MTGRFGVALAAVLFGVVVFVGAQARQIEPSGLWSSRAEAESRRTEQRSEQIGIDASRRGAIDKGIDWLNMGIDMARDEKEFLESWPELHPDDREFDPNYTPPGMPEVPISCDENEECYDCYEKAHKRVNFVRVQLEKLRAIYDSTKSMVTNAVAFGDNVSGIHGALGIAWQNERASILKSLDKLGQTYDSKKRGLMESLERGLRDIEECEKEHFNNADWYNRFGFIYYEFMSVRYRR